MSKNNFRIPFGGSAISGQILLTVSQDGSILTIRYLSLDGNIPTDRQQGHQIRLGEKADGVRLCFINASTETVEVSLSQRERRRMSEQRFLARGRARKAKEMVRAAMGALILDDDIDAGTNPR